MSIGKYLSVSDEEMDSITASNSFICERKHGSPDTASLSQLDQDVFSISEEIEEYILEEHNNNNALFEVVLEPHTVTPSPLHTSALWSPCPSVPMVSQTQPKV